MRKNRVLILLAAVSILQGGKVLRGADPEWKKNRLTDAFLSEGACVGDFNKDGKVDIASGPYWYEGPEFTKKHEYYALPEKAWDPAKEYSNCFLQFTYDVNGDGWPDVVVAGFPTRDARWYENPKGKDGHWAEHMIHAQHVDNESPDFVDLFHDNHPVFLSNCDGLMGYLSPGADVTQPWDFHPISDRPGYKNFTHGIGAGDVNGDGLLDIIARDGWFEQPKPQQGKTRAPVDAAWKFHPADFAQAGAQMFAYDVDGDGRADVITSVHAHHYGIAWYRQKEDGTFEKHVITGDPKEPGPYNVVISQPHAMALADVDGDGLLDIVTGKRRFAHGDHGDVEPLSAPVTYWFKLVRDPEKGVQWVPHLIDDNTGVGTQVTVADLNGDGRPDVLVGNKLGTTILTQTGPGGPQGHAARKVLVFALTEGFRHGSIAIGKTTLTEMGMKSGEFHTVVSDDLANFDPGVIDQFSAVVFLNTTMEIPFNEAQKKALTDYVSSGKGGFVGIHAATDTLYQWPAYGEMIGGHFDGHPWTANVNVTIRKEVENPFTAMFPAEFPLTEEIYQMKDYDRSKCNVGLSLDTSKTDMTRPGIKRTDGDFPVSWVKNYGKGRVFYTSMGHNDAVYQREDYQKHVLAGLKWVMGDMEADVASHALPK